MPILAADLEFITPEMCAVYRKATRGQLDGLAAAIERMRSADVPWSDARDDAYGIAHNIKGQGNSFGYPLMTDVGVSLLVLLRGREACDEGVIRIAEAHLAAMQTIMDKDIQGDGGATGQALVQRLSTLSASISA